MDTDRAIVMTARDIGAAPYQPLGTSDGVEHTVLWTDGTSMTGVLTIAAGTRLGRHAHRTHHHHMWITGGEVVVLGKRLGPGSYVHIPAGVPHDIDATETNGGTMYYTYSLPG